MIKILSIILLISYVGYGQLYFYETPYSKFIYVDKSHSYLVPHAAKCFENAFKFHRNFWNYAPEGKVSVLFNDFTDLGNGGAMAMPFNYLNIGIGSFEYIYDVLPANERMGWLMNHELTHTVMTDKPTNVDLFYRHALGGKVLPTDANPVTMLYSYLTTPRWYAPRWFHEGIACFMETWMAGGMGRSLGGYDEMVFRMMVKEKSYFYNVVGLESEGTAIDFKVGANSYLYGTRFVGYLANKYGVQKLRQFFIRDSESSRFFANQFEKVYGNGIEDVWDEWILWEKEHQENNLSKVNKYELTETRDICDEAFGSVSRTFYDKVNNRLIMAVNFPGELSHFASIDINTGERIKITDMTSPTLYYVTSLSFDDSSGTLFYSVNNHDWRSLESFNINTGDKERLISYTRSGDFAFNRIDKSLWGIKSHEGRNSLVKFPPPYREMIPVYTIPYGENLFDVDISPDGTLLSATLADVGGNQKVITFRLADLNEGKDNYEVIYEFEDNTASNFVFSPDNKFLYGSSFYTGVSNIYRIKLENKEVELLSNCEVGLFRPLPLDDDSLVAYRFTASGMKPVIMKIKPIESVNAVEYLGQKIFENNPELESFMLPPPSSISLDTLHTVSGDYNVLSNMMLSALYPVVEGYKDFPSYGLEATMFDRTYVSSLKINLSYSPNKLIEKKQRLHSKIEFNYFSLSLSAGYNKTDFFDLLGDTKESRAGYYYSAAFKHYYMFMKPSILYARIYFTGFGDLEELPEYQNIAANYSKLYSAGINLNYSFLRKSLGGVEDEEGYIGDLNLYGSMANNKYYPKVVLSNDFGKLLFLRNSSLWIRTVGGVSLNPLINDTNENSPFQYFYFGGFGNNYIDHLALSRYRKLNSFPGVEINELGSENFFKTTAEINLTPIRFKRFGWLSYYVTYCRLSLFSMALYGNEIQNSSKMYYNAGAQLDFELVLFSLIKSNLSFGYARSFTKGVIPRNEYMISLKIL